MQEIKQLLLRLGVNPDASEGIMTGPMADAHIQGYMNHGWTLFAVNPGSIDQGTSSLSVHYVLVRGQAVGLPNQTIEDMEEQAERAKWADPVPA